MRSPVFYAKTALHKLADSNIGYSDNVYTFPYFCAFMIKRYLSDFSS